MAQDDWQKLLREASGLRKAGRFDEAAAVYKQLLQVNPDLPDSWYNLAWLQRQAGEFEQSLASYQRALDLKVSGPEEVHLNRAVIYSDHLFRPADALRELGRALDHDPHFVGALLNLGNLHEDLGERDAALSAYQRALAAEPDNVLALARLAGLSHARALDEGLAERLRGALRRTELRPAERADLGFALGNLLDAAGRHDEAFAAIVEANAASRAASGARYDRAGHERLVDRLIATFDRPAAGERRASPLFICGMWRSGSTLVEQTLGRHSQVTAAGELALIGSIASRISGYPEAAPKLDRETLEGMRADYLNGLPEQPATDRVVTDKRPDNFLHIGLIKLLFPAAKIVHTVRNRLDNLLSLYFLHLDPGMAYALDLEDAAHWYAQHERLTAHWARLYPDDIIAVDYDAMVHDPRPALEPVLRACGLPWEDALLDFGRAAGPVKTASVWQVREPLHSRSSGRWRNYERQLAAITAD